MQLFYPLKTMHHSICNIFRYLLPLTLLQMEWLIAQKWQEWFSSSILTCRGDHPVTDPWVCDGLIQMLIAMKQHCWCSWWYALQTPSGGLKIECVFCIRKFWELNAHMRKHNTNPRNLLGNTFLIKCALISSYFVSKILCVCESTTREAPCSLIILLTYGPTFFPLSYQRF